MNPTIQALINWHEERAADGADKHFHALAAAALRQAVPNTQPNISLAQQQLYSGQIGAGSQFTSNLR